MGYLSPLSPSQRRKAMPTCLRLLTQLMRCALRLAAASAGSRSAARMAMMAITTSSSISVKALFCLRILFIGSMVFGLRLWGDGPSKLPDSNAQSTPVEKLLSNAGANRFLREMPNETAGQFFGGGVRREIFTRDV